MARRSPENYSQQQDEQCMCKNQSHETVSYCHNCN